MKNTAFYSALILRMEKLYKSVSLLLWRKRMDGYHESASQGHGIYGNDIKSPLQDCIVNIMANSPSDAATIPGNDRPAPGSPAPPNTTAKTGTDKPHEAVGSVAENHSGSFIEKTNGSDMYPEIVNKLEHSIWEHIHATIRYARQGDEKNATMHSDIANSACKELAHYLDDEHYQAFIIKIGEHLDTYKTRQGS